MSRDKTPRMSVTEYRALVGAPAPEKKANKYGAKAEAFDGHWFDSQLEIARYKTLRLCQSAGVIANLKVHPRYTISEACEVEGVKQRAVEYEADFEYEHEGVVVTEDVKGMVTNEAKRRMKQFAARYGRRVRIVTAHDAGIGAA